MIIRNMFKSNINREINGVIKMNTSNEEVLKQELEDLHQKCDWTWTTKNGVNGYVVRGKGGYASNSIFLPCAGYGNGTSLYCAGSYGYSWSSVPDSGSYNSWYLRFGSGRHGMSNGYSRYGGQSVRPVQGSAN